MFKKLLLFTILFIFYHKSQAESTFDFNWNYNAYIYYTKSSYADSILNPENRIFKIPENKFVFDQRLESKLQINDLLFLIRPRIVSTYNQINVQYSQDEETLSTKYDLTDFFYEQLWTPQLSTTLGLQTYQWGPAEIYNSSNSFFNFDNEQKNLTHKEKGKILARLNYELVKNQDFVFIIEPVSNNERSLIADHDFSAQGMIKYERRQDSNAGNYFGLVLGRPNQADFLLGEYFNYQHDSGLSVYADLKQLYNQIYFVPVESNGLIQMQQFTSDLNISSLSIIGLRYESDFDLRFEYIFNSSGYTKEQFNQSLLSVIYPTLYQKINSERFNQNGLDFLTQHYLYVSLRKTDLFSYSDLNFYFRSITGFMDYSGSEQIEMEKNFGDYFNLFFSGTLFRGDIDSEFKLNNDWLMTLGLRVML